MDDYASPDVLVDTDWVADRLEDPDVRIVEVDVDTASYEQGHIPGAVGWNWATQLCDTVVRDVTPPGELAALLGASGIAPDTTVVLYGDNNNWFAAWAFWQLEMYGHGDVRIVDGGRAKWVAEGRPLSTEAPGHAATAYPVPEPDLSVRSFLPDVQRAVDVRRTGLVDVRSPAEFTGEILAPPGLPETCQRGGHIPGAANIPWGKAVNEEGTFRSAAELRELYEGAGITPDRPVITYCRIGERSSHSWFVLKHLLGYDDVRNYDGSWTEWGNLVGAAVER
jgi:thiosulfate/3-mercaptopyruvate sulfurtransferase